MAVASDGEDRAIGVEGGASDVKGETGSGKHKKCGEGGVGGGAGQECDEGGASGAAGGKRETSEAPRGRRNVAMVFVALMVAMSKRICWLPMELKA